MRRRFRLWRAFAPEGGPVPFLLLILAVLWAARGAIAARWVPGDEVLWHTGLLAVLLGCGLGCRPLRGGWALLLLGLCGLLYAGWWVARLSSPAWAVLRALWARDGSLASLWLQEMGTRLLLLGQDLLAWLRSWSGVGGAVGGQVSLLWMALILWAGAAFAGWSAARGRHPLRSFVPLLAALATSVFLSGAGAGYVLLVTACLVMRVPLAVLAQRERDWDARRVPYSDELRFDTRVVAVLATLGFVVLATTVPNIRVRQIVDWFWRQIEAPERTAGETLERAFPGTRPASGGGLQTVRAELPRDHLLGGHPNLGQALVMEVALEDGSTASGQGLNWRGAVYSEYVGVGWRQGYLDAVERPAHAALGPPERAGRRPLRQTFTLLAAQGRTLYAANEPQSVDAVVTVQRLTRSGELVALQGGARRYRVLSLVPVVSGAELARAPAVYPDEIESAYLSLPLDLPERVGELAREMTRGAETPYGQALALERALRTFPYDLEVAKPPEGRDVVDYFLFDLQRGYCDYFASSMVVMARSLGIPARLAVGYATGEYDAQRDLILVREEDAHSWPELYFPGYGWIPFEPTPGLRAVEREAVEGLPEGALRPGRPWWLEMQVEARIVWLRWRSRVLVVLTSLLALRAGWRLWRRWRPLRGGGGGIERAYRALWGAALWLGVDVHAGDTPSEFASAAERALVQRRARLRFLRRPVERLAERTRGGVRRVVGVVERASYARGEPDARAVRRARREALLLALTLRLLGWLSVGA